jgi:hypothetical protein
MGRDHMLRLAATVALTIGIATAAYADHEDGPPPSSVRVQKAPEIDPSQVIAGLTLLAGGLAVLRGRRDRK